MTRLNQFRQRIGLSTKPQVENDISKIQHGEGDFDHKIKRIALMCMKKIEPEPKIEPIPQKGEGVKPAKVKLIESTSNELPGDLLRKKLLKKMLREKKMKSLGDRVKSAPIAGSGLVIAGSSDGQSRSKTLPKTKTYKLNPKPLVGGFVITIPAIIAGISAAASSAMATGIPTALATGAASALAGVAVRKLAGEGTFSKALKNIIKDTSITLKDLPEKAQNLIKKGVKELQENPTKKGLVRLGIKIAPIAREIIHKKVKKTIVGKGLSLAGAGILTPINLGQFNKDFVKKFSMSILR